MSETAYEWIIVFTFFLLAAGLTVAEALWVSTRGSDAFGRSLAYAALSNVIGFCIGFAVVFVIFGVLLMVTFEPPTKNQGLMNTGMTAGVIIGILVNPILLTLLKRVFLALLKIRSVTWPWTYSLVSSVLTIVISLLIPSAIAYFVYR